MNYTTVRRYLLLSLCFAMVCIAACTCNKSKYRVDVSKQQVTLQVERFDQDFLAIPHVNADQQIKLLRERYPSFFPFYLEQILGFEHPNDSTPALRDSLLSFFSNPYYKKLFDTTELVYKNFDDITAELAEGMKHYKYYFPSFTAPKILTFVNGPRSFTYGDSLLAIGLDNYLGSDYYYYRIVQPPIPEFLVRRLSKEYIVPNAMHVLATNYFPYDDTNKNLLDDMIYNGKVLFLLNHILPETPDSLITGFREKDLEWLEQNETEIWKYFIKFNLLYKTDPLVYKRYVNDGPNTTGMPPEAPGNVGSWVGWRIVQEYAEKNPSLTLKQIMEEMNSQKILTESKYKPNKRII